MILQFCAVLCTKLLCLVYSAAHCLPRLLLHAAARRLCTLAQASRNPGTATLSAVTRSAHESLEQLQLPLLHEPRTLVPPRRTHARTHARTLTRTPKYLHARPHHYQGYSSTRSAPFSPPRPAGYISLPELFEFGALMAVINLVLWFVAGSVWWRFLGLF